MTDNPLTKINYFTGFFLRAEDLRRAEAYRDHTRWLHNQLFHGPGIVRGYRDSLEVVPNDRGTGIRVKPGMAIDGMGRELLLDTTVEQTLQRETYDLPRTIYVRLRYAAREIDARRNEANVEYTGNAFIEEYALVEVSADAPRLGEHAIELARIELTANGTRIRPVPGARQAGPDEIDMAHRPLTGIARAQFRLEDFAELVHDDEFLVPAEDNVRRRIAEVTTGERGRVFGVSLFPKGQAIVKWHQEVSVDQRGATEYTVVIENLSKQDTDVKLTVYRIG